MELGDEAAVMFKQLVRKDVPVKQASDMVCAWLLSRKETVTETIIEPPEKRPWE